MQESGKPIVREETKTVLFLESQPPYATGDVATFPKSRADRLIAAGVAEPHTLPKASKKQATPRESEPPYQTK